MNKIGIIGYGEIGSSLHNVYKEFEYNVEIIDPFLGLNGDLLNCDLLNICIPFVDGFIEVVNEYIDLLNFKYISQDRLEGDDVIYLSQKMIKTHLELFKNLDIIIITNDNDFLQLVDNHVHIYNMQFKELMKRGYSDPKIDLLFKAIYGDKSDNIPKIGSGITKEKALMLSTMEDTEREKYIKDNGYEDKFRLNMKLISFENIPEEYTKIFSNNIRMILE